MRGTPARDALDGAITAIAAAGCETPRLDAEVLLAHVLGVARERLLIDGDLVVEGPAVRAYQDAVRRRAVEREPVAYIVGHRGFRRLDLAVDSRVLVPRARDRAAGRGGAHAQAGSERARCRHRQRRGGARAQGRAPRPAGDGQRPERELASAGSSQRCAVGARRCAGCRADLLDDIPDEFDAVLSNLPYVAESERATLAPEILRHEPPEALFAGADGLVAIRALLALLRERRRVSLVALEVGASHAAQVSGLLASAGFSRVRSERDLAGIERVLIGERGG